MEKPDILESVPLINRLCKSLLLIISDKADAGFAAKGIIYQVLTNATAMCRDNTIGYELGYCFDLVRQTNCTWQQMDQVRASLTKEMLSTLGAVSIRDYSIQLALAQESKIISGLTFASRQDVDDLITELQPSFLSAEETAGDTMDSMVYRGLIELHAALIDFLSQTARPLPLMLGYSFADVLPSLVISQRLYGDASRYDEIRSENKIVHPAFCPTSGRALSV
jgi:prophage DNA circulation protein